MSDEVNAGQLRAFVERIERLNEVKKALAEDIKEVYAEAKGNGFDVAILRKIVSLRARPRSVWSSARPFSASPCAPTSCRSLRPSPTIPTATNISTLLGR